MTSPLGQRMGPFELVEEVTVPGPGLWFRGERTKYHRGPREAWVRVLDVHEIKAMRQAYAALGRLSDVRWPHALGFYEGAGAIAVTGPTGTPLSQLVALRATDEPPLTPSTLIDLCVDLTEALVHAHDRGVIHGALWADVVGLDHSGALTVWGLAENAPVPGRWVPPEVARRQAPDKLSDQWALGATLAAIVTGKPPWVEGEHARVHSTCLAGGPVGEQWPALGRILDRMVAVRPANRYPTLHAVRRAFLALARRCEAPSSRRELGRLLADHVQAPSFTAPERSPMPTPPRIQLPLPSTATPATDIDTEVETTRPAAVRVKLPNESLPIVRPDVGSYGPAPVAKAPAAAVASRPLTGVRDDLDDIRVVAVEIEDTDQGVPMSLKGPTPATDDMPLPSPEDVFGGIDIFQEDPLDAPALSMPAMAIPDPMHAAGRSGGGVTAVPGTDPGFTSFDSSFDAISLDDPDPVRGPVSPSESFFSGAFGGQVATDEAGEEIFFERRTPSRVERVAQGLIVANSCLAALWLVVRVF